MYFYHAYWPSYWYDFEHAAHLQKASKQLLVSACNKNYNDSCKFLRGGPACSAANGQTPSCHYDCPSSYRRLSNSNNVNNNEVPVWANLQASKHNLRVMYVYMCMRSTFKSMLKSQFKLTISCDCQAAKEVHLLHNFD